MLKKAGIVVLGAAAGVMSLSGMAFAGTADNGSSHDDNDKGTSHHDKGDDKGHEGTRCGDDIAISDGNKLVDASNLLANSEVDLLNILSNTGGDDCEGGDDVALSSGNKLVDASNLLANSDVDALNILSNTA